MNAPIGLSDHPWLEPTANGQDVRDVDSRDPLRQRVRDEVAKLDSLNDDHPDWDQVVRDAQRFTHAWAKDLLVGSYAAFALFQSRGLVGLLDGMSLLSGMLSRCWEELEPPSRRMRARAQAIDWFVAKTEMSLASWNASVDPTTLKELERSAAHLAAWVHERFGDRAPALGGLRDGIGRLVAATPACEVPVSASSRASPPSEPCGNRLSNDVATRCADLAHQLKRVATELRGAALDDPRGYALLRLALAISLRVPPSRGDEYTAVPAPPDVIRQQIVAASAAENWEALVVAAEGALATRPVWIDAHRHAARGLAALGEGYVEARQAVIAGTALFVRRLEPVLRARFVDGTPLCSEAAHAWLLDEGILPRPDEPVTARDVGAGPQDPVEVARAGALDDALAQLADLSLRSEGQRDRFRAGLAMAEVLAESKRFGSADRMFTSLHESVERFGLERWEPDLVRSLYRSHLACLRQLGEGSTPTGVERRRAALLRDLCRVDPLAAIEADLGSRETVTGGDR